MRWAHTPACFSGKLTIRTIEGNVVAHNQRILAVFIHDGADRMPPGLIQALISEQTFRGFADGLVVHGYLFSAHP